LHERQADVIAETYSLLKQLFTCLENYTEPFRDEGDAPLDVDREQASDALGLFRAPRKITNSRKLYGYKTAIYEAAG
jgi:hypothetical protein